MHLLTFKQICKVWLSLYLKREFASRVFSAPFKKSLFSRIFSAVLLLVHKYFLFCWVWQSRADTREFPVLIHYKLDEADQTEAAALHSHIHANVNTQLVEKTHKMLPWA